MGEEDRSPHFWRERLNTGAIFEKKEGREEKKKREERRGGSSIWESRTLSFIRERKRATLGKPKKEEERRRNTSPPSPGLRGEGRGHTKLDPIVLQEGGKEGHFECRHCQGSRSKISEEERTKPPKAEKLRLTKKEEEVADSKSR